MEKLVSSRLQFRVDNVNSDGLFVWRQLYQDLVSQCLFRSIFSSHQNQTSWRWSTDRKFKSPDIFLEDNDRVAQRRTSPMSHGVLGHRPLKGFQFFEIQVLRREYYIQLGVCHIPSDLRTCTIGTKRSWVYLCDSTAYIRMNAKQSETLMPMIEPGDKIGFAVDVDKREMAFYHNGNRIAHCTEVGLPGKDLYPCAFLGGDNVVVRIQAPSFKYEL